ncbi:MAG TPA: ATP-binding protein [Candidatus Limnocylindrales bacterium]
MIGPAIASVRAHRWRVATLRAAGTPAGRLTLAGGVVVGLLAVAALVDAGGEWRAWRTAMWIVAAAVALGSTLLGARDTTGRERRTRGLVAAALGCATLGELLRGTDLAAGVGGTPGPADVAYLAAALPIAAVIRSAVVGRISRGEEFALYLDAGMVFAAIAALLIAATEGARPSTGISALLLAYYPLFFLGTTGAGLVTALATRVELVPRGAFAILAGTGLLGVTFLDWMQRAAGAGSAGVSGSDLLYAAAMLVVGVGGATWSERLDRGEAYIRWAGRLINVLPLAAVGVSVLLLVTYGADVARPDNLLIRGAVAATVGLAIVRQSVLLVAVRQARASSEAALARMDRAEAEQRRRADELARVLAASEQLALSRTNGWGTQAIVDALARDGIVGFVTRLDQGDTFRVIAGSAPPGAPAELHRAALPPEHRRLLDDPRPRVTRRSGPFSMPGVINQGRHLAPAGAEPTATLTLPLMDHEGVCLGALHLIDPDHERVLEPGFVDLARLAASQLAVALDNRALLARARAQLEETQRVQHQLVQASKLSAVGELAAAVAHEVNNPLTGILGFVELVLEDLPSDDPHRRDLETVRDEALRARRIVRALLDFARPRPPRRMPTDVNALSRETIELLRYHVERGGVRIEERYADLSEVELDPDAIKQVLLNLLHNAVQAMPQGGTLTVSTAGGAGLVSISVADDGVGMAREIRERVFVPFFTTREVGAGAGLGLSVSLGIVESHGGSIEVQSQPGRGSVFTVHLPSVTPTVEPPSAGDEADGAHRSAAPVPAALDPQESAA